MSEVNENDLRASDQDRQAAVERLRLAMNEGRISLLEYDERLTRAYQAATYGELAALFLDLPPVADVARVQSARPVRPAARAPVRRDGAVGLFQQLPAGLKVLWTLWFTAVTINLVVWGLVSLSTFEPIYFWPVWVAGPAGAALTGISAGVLFFRGDEDSVQ